MGVLWVGYLPISIYLSFSPSKCVCATPTAKIRYSRLCWLSLVRAASRILILQAWRWGMNTCGARETHVLRFSDSPFLHPCAACLARTLLGARGVSLRREWNGNVPISHFIKHKHTLTNTRPLSLPPPPLSHSIYDSLNLPFSVAAQQIFVTDKFGFLCTLAQCEWNRKAREVCR